MMFACTLAALGMFATSTPQEALDEAPVAAARSAADGEPRKQSTVQPNDDTGTFLPWRALARAGVGISISDAATLFAGLVAGGVGVASTFAALMVLGWLVGQPLPPLLSSLAIQGFWLSLPCLAACTPLMFVASVRLPITFITSIIAPTVSKQDVIRRGLPHTLMDVLLTITPLLAAGGVLLATLCMGLVVVRHVPWKRDRSDNFLVSMVLYFGLPFYVVPLLLAALTAGALASTILLGRVVTSTAVHAWADAGESSHQVHP